MVAYVFFPHGIKASGEKKMSSRQNWTLLTLTKHLHTHMNFIFRWVRKTGTLVCGLYIRVATKLDTRTVPSISIVPKAGDAFNVDAEHCLNVLINEEFH